MNARVINICQYEKNPRTGEDLGFSEENILSAIEHKTIKRWAYILHDKDLYSEQEEEKCIEALAAEYDRMEGPSLSKEEYIRDNQWVHAGETKPRHWHIVAKTDSAKELQVFATWFGVKEQYIDVPKGKGAFLDCVQYLTHEAENQQKDGKHRYSDEEVKANFDFRKELDELAANRNKYGKDLSIRDQYRYRVLYEGLTIRQLVKEDKLAYMDDFAVLEKLRFKYINDYAPLPRIRINYYVCGLGGIGKGLICRALARSLYPEYENDQDIFFEVGAKGAPFEGYDGQPVIIWNDRRALELLTELGGRGNVFNVFDTHPTRGRQNIKYSSVYLCNEVNIVNSVQDYGEFLDGLVGEYVDKNGQFHEIDEKSQSYRRFPFIIPLHEEDFDLLMNRGFFEGTREYDQYIRYNNIRGNMRRIAELCRGNENLRRELESQTVGFVVDKHNRLLDNYRSSTTQRSEEDIRKICKDFGTVKEESIMSFEPEQRTIFDYNGTEIDVRDIPF